MLTGFPRTRWPRRRFSESYAVRISVKISRIWEFRVIWEQWPVGCCSYSTLGSRANDYVKNLTCITCIKSSMSVYAPHLVQSVRLHLSKYRGVTMLTGFPRTRWPRRRLSESYAVRISVKTSRIWEFRVIWEQWPVGCCSYSTLGSRANDYVKNLTTLGFWLHHSPWSLGCWTNNTLAAWSLSPNPSMHK